MYVVTVQFEIPEDSVSRFRQLILRQAENSLERESGCLQFDVVSDPQDPGRFFLYEVYVDEEAFRLHLESAHFLDFDAQSQPLYQHKNAQAWERIWPI